MLLIFFSVSTALLLRLCFPYAHTIDTIALIGK